MPQFIPIPDSSVTTDSPCTGRHATMAMDFLLHSIDQEPFTWDRDNLIPRGMSITQYINALQAADRYDQKLLLESVQS